jgi:hypothetical protein
MCIASLLEQEAGVWNQDEHSSSEEIEELEMMPLGRRLFPKRTPSSENCNKTRFTASLSKMISYKSRLGFRYSKLKGMLKVILCMLNFTAPTSTNDVNLGAKPIDKPDH